MLGELTLARLRELRLRGMADAFCVQEENAEVAGLSFAERFGLLVDAEWTHRRNHTLARLLREAKLRLPAVPEDVDYHSARGLDRAVLRSLFQGGFVRSHQNVLFFGPTGVGKTYLACALGHAACRLGLRVRYVRLGRLLAEIALARLDGSYGALAARLAKTDLLILDDFGLAPLTATEARELLDLVDDRYLVRSTVVASQLPLPEWHRTIGDPTLADAILDRLVHNAHKLTLSGESLRKTKGGEGRSETEKNATLGD
ncbi:MAG: IS21-like element helper ATPase IstB [Actinobacteria bacterium]|nr:IS21-like element helper ATPase IstB [Actinomycetota bacterium]